jgi:hypothetical protein
VKVLADFDGNAQVFEQRCREAAGEFRALGRRGFGSLFEVGQAIGMEVLGDGGAIDGDAAAGEGGEERLGGEPGGIFDADEQI